MSALKVSTSLTDEHVVFDIAPNSIVPANMLRHGIQTVALIVALFCIGATLVASLVLGLEMLTIGAFVAFTMMLMIGMPLILACLEDAIDSDLE